MSSLGKASHGDEEDFLGGDVPRDVTVWGKPRPRAWALVITGCHFANRTKCNWSNGSRSGTSAGVGNKSVMNCGEMPWKKGGKKTPTGLVDEWSALR